MKEYLLKKLTEALKAYTRLVEDTITKVQNGDLTTISSISASAGLQHWQRTRKSLTEDVVTYLSVDEIISAFGPRPQLLVLDVFEIQFQHYRWVTLAEREQLCKAFPSLFFINAKIK